MERRPLIERLTECPEMSAKALVTCLIEAADEFAAGAPQHDDMTLLVMKVLPEPINGRQASFPHS